MLREKDNELFVRKDILNVFTKLNENFILVINDFKEEENVILKKLLNLFKKNNINIVRENIDDILIIKSSV